MAQSKYATREVLPRLNQPAIQIKAIVTVATIEPSLSSKTPMVEAAFNSAGQYLNEQAAQGNTAALFFDFMGARFRASCAPVGPSDEYNADEEEADR